MCVTETLERLKGIEKRIQKEGFVSREDRLFFSDWAITDYVFSISRLGTIEVQGVTFKFSQSVPKAAKLCYLQGKSNKLNDSLCIKPKTIETLSETGMRSPLTSMSSIFAYLPDDLNNYQMQRIAHEETLLSYAAPFIVRGKWGRKICSLPRVNNQIKSILNAYSEQWLKMYELCVNCRDFLPEKDLEQILRAWDWLRLLVHEHRQVLLKFLRSDEAKEKASKVQVSKEIRDFALALSKGINPCDPEIEPYKYQLMEICIKVAGKADAFEQKFWQPYITSLNNWANELKNSPDVVAVNSSEAGEIQRNRSGTGERRKNSRFRLRQIAKKLTQQDFPKPPP